MTGCANTSATSLPIDNFCGWAKPILLTKDEISHLSAYSSNEIADYNDVYVKKCGKKK
jgi:hypothetical protein